jgi:hypothetical protein
VNLRARSELPEFQLISWAGPCRVGRSSWELQNDIRAKTECDSAARHRMADLPNLTILADKYHVDGELHAEGMNCFAGSDEHTFPGIKSPMLQ